MGFFKELKEDFSQAIGELMPEDDVNTADNSEQMVNTLDLEAATNNEEAENEMMEWLENISTEDTTEDTFEEIITDESIPDDSTLDEDIYEDSVEEEILVEGMEDEIEDMGEKVDLNVDTNVDEFDENIDLELLDTLSSEEEQVEDKNKKSDNKVRAASVASDDDVTVISKGTTINGSISSDGSLEIMGNITGDVECLGKLSITGKIVGNSTAAEVYVNTDRLEGSINSEGSVKVGLGTVVVGDIVATSGVIAGAVKGEIDINGPIVIDSTAIIKGNIKAKSVQINNGAVVEGFCSLSYSDVDLDNVFE
jgi:cytoskeletal protein CcmA (bactofilin family)